MKISAIAFSLTGMHTGERLKSYFEGKGDSFLLDAKSRYVENSVKMSCRSWAESHFYDSDALFYIGACGIAVRSIAPFVESKKKDPAVLVIDECGKFVISLLSGHLGGANALAAEAAAFLDAVPVITTATDLHSRFAVDVFAKENGCSIFHMTAAKEVSAALLAQKTVGFYSEFSREGALPAGLLDCTEAVRRGEKELPECGVAVTIHRDCLPFHKTVQVVPCTVSLGMGCRRDRDPAAVEDAASSFLEKERLYPEAVRNIASISIKKDEKGLILLSEKLGVPFVTFTPEELLGAPGEYTASEFVKSITGVDNVCERSAVLASDAGTILKGKTAGDGVTVSAAVKEWRIRF